MTAMAVTVVMKAGTAATKDDAVAATTMAGVDTAIMAAATKVRRWRQGGGLLTLLLALSAQAEELGGNLEALLRHAREHNPELHAAARATDAAQQRVPAAGALADPVLRMEMMDVSKNGSPSLLPSQVGSTRYYVIQSLPWWGKRDNQQAQAAAQAAQSAGQSALTWSKLSARIKQAQAQRYYGLVSLTLSRQTLQQLETLNQVAQTRYAHGAGSQQEIIRAQLESSNWRTEILNQENELHHWDSRLNALLARPLHEPLVAPAGWRALPALPDFAQRLAQSPVLRVAEAGVDGAGKSRDGVYLNRYPNFNLGIAPNQVGNAVRTWDLMLEFNIPLQQDSRRAQEREADSSLAAAEAAREAVRYQLQTDLAENQSAWETAKRNADIARNRMIPQAQFTYDAALTAYGNGRVDFASLLEAQRQLWQAQQQALKAQLEMQLRFADIEALLGEE